MCDSRRWAHCGARNEMTPTWTIVKGCQRQSAWHWDEIRLSRDERKEKECSLFWHRQQASLIVRWQSDVATLEQNALIVRFAKNVCQSIRGYIQVQARCRGGLDRNQFDVCFAIAQHLSRQRKLLNFSRCLSKIDNYQQSNYSHAAIWQFRN